MPGGEEASYEAPLTNKGLFLQGDLAQWACAQEAAERQGGSSQVGVR